MKRLLLPLIAALSLPTAVDAFPWSDIVVTTDLGEKYVVKDSAVTKTTYKVEDAISILKKNAREEERKYTNCLWQYTKRLKAKTEKYCSSLYAPYETNGYLHGDSHTLSWEREKTHWVLVKYRPIFVDLNKNKESLGYKYISCMNPKLKLTTQKIWERISSVEEYQPKKLSFTAYESMKQKVCKKYAKF